MNLPTRLTIVRILLAIVFTGFMLLPDISWAPTVALVIFIVAAITDKIDGYLPRKNNQVTTLGTFLDPIADKMLVGLALLLLTYSGTVPVWVCAIILVRDYAVDGMRMVAARQSVEIPASFLGKFKTTIQMTALIILLLNNIAKNEIIGIIGNIALYLALALTVFSAVDYIHKGYKKFIATAN